MGASADPKQLFEALRRAGATITRTGAGVYHFEVKLAGDPAATKSPSATHTETLVGDVKLGADKRIAEVTYERTTRAEKDGQTATSTSLVTVELSGYGMPVKVERPTDVVIVK